MTQEEFDTLKPGDVVQNTINKSIKTILPAGYPCEPTVATSKDRIASRIEDWKIFARALPKPSLVLVDQGRLSAQGPMPMPVPGEDEPEKED